MITADTSSLIAFFAGEEAKDTSLLERSLEDGVLVLVPPVLSEVLSDPKLPKQHEKPLKEIYLPIVLEGFWERVGHLRRKVLSKKRKARLADALIFQFCLDYNLSLITRDSDFKNFAKESKLNIL